MAVFYYFGLAAAVYGGPLLYRATAGASEAVQRRADADTGSRPHLNGPEYAWPLDRSWVVNTDYDLVSTYVACDPLFAERLLADATLEVLPVSLDARVNEGADEVNGTGYDHR